MPVAEPALAIGDRGLVWFALAFATTQLVEVPIFALALRSARPSRPSRPLAARAAIAFGASAITHPVVWYVMPRVTLALLVLVARGGFSLGVTAATLVYGALAEGFAVVVEAAYLRAFGVRRALLWALFANAASGLVGTAVVLLLGEGISALQR